jgi:hypothetical protein
MPMKMPSDEPMKRSQPMADAGLDGDLDLGAPMTSAL